MLPRIKEKHGWFIEECHSHNRPLEQQLIGAAGEPLGADSMVVLNIQVEATRVLKEVLCFALDSNKPLWKGELALQTVDSYILGTNSLESLGFKITQQDGTTVGSETTSRRKETMLTESSAATDLPVSTVQPSHLSMAEVESTLQEQANKPEAVHPVLLSRNLRIGPLQTRMVRVHVGDALPLGSFRLGRVHSSRQLESQQCDHLEGLWEGTQQFEVPVTNWGLSSVMLPRDTGIGELEPVELCSAYGRPDMGGAIKPDSSHCKW